MHPMAPPRVGGAREGEIHPKEGLLVVDGIPELVQLLCLPLLQVRLARVVADAGQLGLLLVLRLVLPPLHPLANMATFTIYSFIEPARIP